MQTKHAKGAKLNALENGDVGFSNKMNPNSQNFVFLSEFNSYKI